MNEMNLSTKQSFAEEIWKADPKIKELLKKSKSLAEARENLFKYLNDLERHYFNIYSDKNYKNVHIIEKSNAKECIRVFKNIIRTESEKLINFSALKKLYQLAKGKITV